MTFGVTKLLGTFLDLEWNKNIAEMLKKGWRRIKLLNIAVGFTSNKQELIQIFLKYTRSILEQSAGVWHCCLNAKTEGIWKGFKGIIKSKLPCRYNTLIYLFI